MNSLISIIVPVYNVELYLEECILSILSQTYSNFELLLIDDGSTDASSDICKRYVKKDTRIKYFKKVNGGLSDARNYGIDRANGEYIAFIDSDDYVAFNFVEMLYKGILEKDCKLVMCGYRRFKNNESFEIEQEIKNYNLKTNEEVLKNILYQIKQEIYTVAAPCKLYHKSIFEDIRFPLGKLNEDMAIIIDVLRKCDKIAVIEQELYYYRVNPESITQQKFNERRMDVIEISQENLYKVQKFFPNLESASKVMLYSRSFEMLTVAYNTSKKFEYQHLKKLLKGLIIEYRGIVIKDKNVRKKAKISAILSYVNIRLVTIILSYIRDRRYS